MVHGYSGEIPNGTGKGLPSNSHRLFLQMGRSRRLSNVPDNQIRKFLWTNVITRFGILQEIITENAPQFTSYKFKNFYKNWGIKLTFATSRHPQSNGQVESTNKIVVNMVEKRLEDAHGRWAEELHGILWAYWTTPKTATLETPFSLVYDTEAIVPTKVHVKTTVSRSLSQEENDKLMVLSLDLLEEKRKAARLRSFERSIRKGRRSSSIDNNPCSSLNFHQPPSIQTPVSSTDTRSPLPTEATLPSTDIFHPTSIDTSV
ncbi:uncharacterized protein LOC111210951 [Brassica napus]|uniref:uncharacterized protein LOC111210951 n=1 Tax=Brassica napus TaxID=3708 RepID=UPI000BBF1DF9|nr:uncharacterized protein LOC111210951 [Brassica napus]